MGLFTEENMFTYLGFTGGMLLALAQVPQIYRVQTRRSSKDISYAYQLCFTVGMVMFLIYYGYYERWAVFTTSTLSLVFILYLTGLKVYLEEVKPRSKRRKTSGGSDGSSPRSDSLGSSLLAADQLEGRNARVDQG